MVVRVLDQFYKSSAKCIHEDESLCVRNCRYCTRKLIIKFAVLVVFENVHETWWSTQRGVWPAALRLSCKLQSHTLSARMFRAHTKSKLRPRRSALGLSAHFTSWAPTHRTHKHATMSTPLTAEYLGTQVDAFDNDIGDECRKIVWILPRADGVTFEYVKRCESCPQLHDGSYGSGRFCSSRCARRVGGLAKKRMWDLKHGLSIHEASNAIDSSSADVYVYPSKSTVLPTSIDQPNIQRTFARFQSPIPKLPQYSETCSDSYHEIVRGAIGSFPHDQQDSKHFSREDQASSGSKMKVATLLNPPSPWLRTILFSPKLFTRHQVESWALRFSFSQTTNSCNPTLGATYIKYVIRDQCAKISQPAALNSTRNLVSLRVRRASIFCDGYMLQINFLYIALHI